MKLSHIGSEMDLHVKGDGSIDGSHHARNRGWWKYGMEGRPRTLNSRYSECFEHQESAPKVKDMHVAP
jgi:hypothetical protein